MLLPSKLVAFHESTLAYLVPVLSHIPEKGIRVVDLYLQCNLAIMNPESFIDALTIAFAAGAVRFDGNKEMIYRA